MIRLGFFRVCIIQYWHGCMIHILHVYQVRTPICTFHKGGKDADSLQVHLTLIHYLRMVLPETRAAYL